MRKNAVAYILGIFSCLWIPFFTLTAEAAGSGSIKGRIVLPGSTVPKSALGVFFQPAGRAPLDDGDGGGGDGGSGGDGGGDGDSGYSEAPWAYQPAQFYTENEQRFVKLENLAAGTYNLMLQYGQQSNSEYQLALKNIRVLEGRVTDLQDLLMKKGGTIEGEIRFPGTIPLGDVNYPTATIHVVGFSGANYQSAPPWMQSRVITATDLQGRFTLNNLPEGTYTLAVTPGGSAAAKYAGEILSKVRVEAEKTISATPFGPFELRSSIGSMGGLVKLIDRLPNGPYGGTIVRATYQAPLQAASLTDAVRYSSYIQVTDDTGAFNFTPLPLGKYSLYIQHPGYKVQEQQNVEATVQGNTGNTFYLEKGTRVLCGTVNLAGAGSYRGDVNNDHKVDLHDALLALQVADRGRPATVQATGDINQDGKIGLAEAIHNLQTIAGLRLASSPLSGTLVMVPGTSLVAVANESGQFRIDSVPEKGAGNWTYDLFVTRGGYKAYKKEGVAAQTACDFNSIQIQLLQNEQVLVGGKQVFTGSIVGRSWLKNDPDPSTIDIAIEDTSFTAKPNGSGNFIFSPVPPGFYKLRYSQSGYKTVVDAGVLVVPDQSTEIRNVVLVPKNGTVKGRIKLEGASDWGNIPIRVEPAEGLPAGSTSFATDNSGFYTMNLPENFDAVSNIPCVLDNRAAGTGRCLTPTVPSYTIRIGGGDWVHSEYQPHTFSNVNVAAGELVDLGEITLQKPPSPPSGVTAAQASGSSVKMTWTASTATDVAGYNVYFGTQSDQITTKANTGLIVVQVMGQWQYTVTGLEKGVNYYLAVEAVDQTGLASSKAPGDGTCFWTIQPEDKGEVFYGDFPFSYPYDIALAGDGLKGYVSNRAGANLAVIDFSGQSPFRSGQINLSGTSPLPLSLAFNPTRNELYVTDWEQRKLFFVNTLNDTIDPNGVSVVGRPQNVLVSPDGTTIYVSVDYVDEKGNNADTITVIDAATRRVAAAILLGDADPKGMAIAGNKLYVVGTWAYKVYVIDLDPESANYQKVLTPLISVGDFPYEAIARPDGAFVYVSHDTLEGRISVINTATNAVSEIVTQAPGATKGKNARGMAISGNILYVVNNGDNTVTLIDTRTNQMLNTVSAVSSGGNGPESIAVSPDGSRLYIVHSGAASVQIRGY